MARLDLATCKEIIKNYRSIATSSYWSSLRAFLTGSYYSGPHSRLAILDFLAGGAQNSFFFNLFSRPRYGAFIHFLDQIWKNHPEKESILQAIEAADSTEEIHEIIKQNKQYLSKKYQLDLREQLKNNGERSEEEKRQRNRNSWSHRLAKPLTFFGAICEGCIDILGVSWLSSFSWFICLGAGTMPLFLACFVGGFVACYYIYRQDSAGLFEEILLGNFFYKNMGTIDEPDYQPLTRPEKIKIALAMIMSICSGISVYALVIPALQAALTILTIAAPLLTIQILAAPMIFLIGALCFNAAKKLIQENQANASDEAMTAGQITKEIAKFCFALIVSATVACITFFLFKSKLGMLFSKSPNVIATVAAYLCAGATALMRFAFCIVTLGKVNSPAVARTQETELIQAPPVTKSSTTAMLMTSGIAGPHAIAQGGLFADTALELINGTPLSLPLATGSVPLAIGAGIANLLLAWSAAKSRMSQDHSLEEQNTSTANKRIK